MKGGKRNTWVLVLIVILFFILRLVGKNWDAGNHLHPDERMLIMVADKLNLLGANKQLYPDFFNYGTFPIYVLRLVSEIFNSTSYNQMLWVGRFLSLGFDFLTLIFVYKICGVLGLKKQTIYLATFFYTIVFFAIQNSNFFVVDVVLTCLFSAAIFFCIKYYKIGGTINVFLWGAFAGLMMATKFSAIVMIICFVILLLLTRRVVALIGFLMTVFGFMFLGMPYAFLPPSGINPAVDLVEIFSKTPNFSSKFLSDIYLQSQMNSNPYIFPYTLQYVDRPAYWYYLVNLFWYGAGPVITILAVFGIKKINRKNWILWLMAIGYFLVIGKSQVKFMRYLLPIYPIICIWAAMGLESVRSRLAKYFLITVALFYSLTFVSIYFKNHTRLEASNWIHKNIAKGSVLAVEHWDDRIPVDNANAYNYVEATWYDLPDNLQKFQQIQSTISRADYYILASNRLSGSLERLDNCAKYRSCYPLTSRFYRDLLANRTQFVKVAEFKTDPGLWNLFGLTDQGADESFTVYDHPRITIFKNSNKL